MFNSVEVEIEVIVELSQFVRVGGVELNKINAILNLVVI